MIRLPNSGDCMRLAKLAPVAVTLLFAAPVAAQSPEILGGVIREPNAWCSTLETLAPTSSPTSSSNASGPTGKPNASIAWSTSSTEAPSSTSRAASFQ